MVAAWAWAGRKLLATQAQRAATTATRDNMPLASHQTLRTSPLARVRTTHSRSIHRKAQPTARSQAIHTLIHDLIYVDNPVAFPRDKR